jgi:transposase-like protein
MPTSIPKFVDISTLLQDEDRCIAFLIESQILIKPRCGECGGDTRRDRKLWRCKVKTCGHAVSILSGSFFANSRLKCCEMMNIAYLWLSKASASTIRTITGHSSITVSSFLGFLRQLVADKVTSDPVEIGGQNIVVEIDECKIGKRKYNRGHTVEGCWVIGGVERTPSRKVFIEVVQNRSAETLLEVIQRCVLPGSTVHTDLWRGYMHLPALGFLHRTVNHSIEFVNATDGTHTNSIEGTWNGLKLTIPPRNRNRGSITRHLLTFIWYRQNSGRKWEAFLDCLRETAFM